MPQVAVSVHAPSAGCPGRAGNLARLGIVFLQHFARLRPRSTGLRMKATIIITPKKAVLDPQGKTVQNALAHLGYEGVNAVHVGKYLEIELTGTDREAARQAVDEACHRFLSNPVIEDYRLEIVD